MMPWNFTCKAGIKCPDHAPKAFNLPVMTLETMTHDNRNSYIDVLIVVIEGSEFLYKISLSCLNDLIEDAFELFPESLEYL